MTAKAIRATVTPGSVWEITNHYINRPDHPCYGTRRVTVDRANDSAFYVVGYFDGDRKATSRIEWPKAAQITQTGEVIRLWGGGINQGPDDLFLTMVPVNA